jgi:hypothetical protein
MTLTPVELKFLLRLLGAPGYRLPIVEIKPNAKTLSTERDRICMSLCSKGLVDYTSEVTRFAIAPAGRTLLNLDTTSLPVTPMELWTLQSCRTAAITAGKINARVPAADRQRLIHNLEGRGLVTIQASRLKEAWVNARGQQFLREEYQPSGTGLILSGNLLNHYVQFLRQGVRPATTTASPPDAAAILALIQQLDQDLQTDNYLPIFYLREQLPLSREALDQQLYALQQQDKIELSTLQDVSAYSAAQLAAGIPQDMGGSLFFVSVN